MNTDFSSRLSFRDAVGATLRDACSRHARLAAIAVLAMLVPSASGTQSRGYCPRMARVPGYGACTNYAGANCGYCAYRCNDDTVVRWNVCAR